jgi:excisionase family DNA binding protein
MTPPAANNSGRRWVSVAHCAEYLDLKPQTIYEKYYRKEIPGARIGRVIRIDLRALERMLEGQGKGKP